MMIGEDPVAVDETAEPRGLARAISRLRDRWRDIAESAHHVITRLPQEELSRRDFTRVREEIIACIEGRGGDVASRARAAALGQTYLGLSDAGRRQFLGVLATENVIAPESVADMTRAVLDAGESVQTDMRDLRAALEPPARQVFRQFNSLPEGIKFLVDLRADLIRFRSSDPALAQLEGDLRGLLASWFDTGFLELRRITWSAPAALLERLANYEAVHEVRNWRDLKNRLDTDRRCYAYFHALMPDEPLIFIEIALVAEMSAAIEPLLDTDAPLGNPNDATTAIFYSISNCQAGLAGISFGNALIKRVVHDLIHEFPGLKTFATLSPIPGFTAWLKGREVTQTPLEAILAKRTWSRDPATANAVKDPLLKLCAHYLVEETRRGGGALDPVAHFHLSNGARIERLDWLGDQSSRGLRSSAGIMVNYLYRLDQIDENHEAYTSGKISYSPAIKALLR
jgi:malonyl-CoA decarboxylase